VRDVFAARTEPAEQLFRRVLGDGAGDGRAHLPRHIYELSIDGSYTNGLVAKCIFRMTNVLTPCTFQNFLLPEALHILMASLPSSAWTEGPGWCLPNFNLSISRCM
jgi:hypothetical protein